MSSDSIKLFVAKNNRSVYSFITFTTCWIFVFLPSIVSLNVVAGGGWDVQLERSEHSVLGHRVYLWSHGRAGRKEVSVIIVSCVLHLLQRKHIFFMTKKKSCMIWFIFSFVYFVFTHPNLNHSIFNHMFVLFQVPGECDQGPAASV